MRQTHTHKYTHTDTHTDTHTHTHTLTHTVTSYFFSCAKKSVLKSLAKHQTLMGSFFAFCVPIRIHVVKHIIILRPIFTTGDDFMYRIQCLSNIKSDICGALQ